MALCSRDDGEDSVTIAFWTSFFSMNVGAVLLSALAWYLGQVLPGEYGIQRSWLFPCQGARPNVSSRGQATVGVGGSELLMPGGDADSGGGGGGDGDRVGPVYVEEPPPTHLDVRVRMRGLRKVYEKSSGSESAEDVVAVDCLDLDLFSGQIFALLGHNGAGKTTSTRAMLPISVVCVVSQSR